MMYDNLRKLAAGYFNNPPSVVPSINGSQAVGPLVNRRTPAVGNAHVIEGISPNNKQLAQGAGVSGPLMGNNQQMPPRANPYLNYPNFNQLFTNTKLAAGPLPFNIPERAGGLDIAGLWGQVPAAARDWITQHEGAITDFIRQLPQRAGGALGAVAGQIHPAFQRHLPAGGVPYVARHRAPQFDMSQLYHATRGLPAGEEAQPAWINNLMQGIPGIARRTPAGRVVRPSAPRLEAPDVEAVA